jgi:hypothetical protein
MHRDRRRHWRGPAEAVSDRQTNLDTLARCPRVDTAGDGSITSGCRSPKSHAYCVIVAPVPTVDADA